MDWGIHLPHLGRQASRQALLDFARHADDLGFHSGWVSDHIAWPKEIHSKYPYTDDGSFAPPPDMPWLDPIGTLFFVAACTERLQLGGTVLILGYRPPMLTAKAMASLDVLSGGRAILGVGVGWMKEEFDVLGMPYDHRGKRADEQLALFEQVFTEPSPSYHGEYYDVPEIGFEPKPVNGRIPVWVGGDTEPAFRRVVRSGDAFHAAFQTVSDVDAAWRRIGELLRRGGSRPLGGPPVRAPLPRSGRADDGEQVDRRLERPDGGHGRGVVGDRGRPHPPRPRRTRWRRRPAGGDGGVHDRGRPAGRRDPQAGRAVRMRSSRRRRR